MHDAENGENIQTTVYCGQAHRVRDGMPVAHRCRVIPAYALTAEAAGDLDQMMSILLTAPLVLGGEYATAPQESR